MDLHLVRQGGLRAAVAVLGAAGALALFATPARGAVTIGAADVTTDSPTALGCSSGAGCGYWQESPAPRSPFDGVIVRWRVRAQNVAGQFRLRVLRFDSSSVTGVHTEPPAPLVAGTNEFEARIPILRGDQIGFNLGIGTSVDRTTPPGATYSSPSPPVADGETRPVPPAFSGELLFNADVEPDLDRDGLGDESQDPDDDGDGVGDADEATLGTDPLRADTDADGHSDSADNCPVLANALQSDFNRNGRGDACDPPRRGACANPLPGTNARDRLTGSEFGDFLLGGGGDDRLSGLGGDDCLEGGAGSDRADGGDGNDKLTGGSGKDVLNGGHGRDRLDAGKGNDAVNSADALRETVNCGKGRDKAKADRADRLRGCERVSRV